MKKTGILFGILIILSGLTYFLVSGDTSSDKSSIDVSDRQFAVDDKDQIARIVLNRRNRDHLEFVKKGEQWIINDSFVASEFVMPHLLTTLEKVEIDYIPQKSATPHIFKEMDRIGIDVEVYDSSNKLLTAYVIGGDISNGYGTNYVMRGAKQPYVVHMRSYSGGLRNRFTYDLDLWRSVAIVKAPLEDIESLSIEYPKNLDASFNIVKENNRYRVSPGSKYTPATSKEANQEVVKGYLTNFDRLFGEGNENKNIRKDSILRLVPFATVRLQMKGQPEKRLDFIPLQEVEQKNTNVSDFKDISNLERFFVGVNQTEMMLAQQRVVGKIFRPYSFFFQ